MSQTLRSGSVGCIGHVSVSKCLLIWQASTRRCSHRASALVYRVSNPMSCALCGTAGAVSDFSPLPGQSDSIPKHLITSNVPPLDSQIPVFRQLLVDSQASVGVLNARIDALQAALARLVRERDNLVLKGKGCKEVLAPVRRIPPELVFEIFSRVRCTRIINPQTAERVEQPPWMLSHICKSWRQTAIGSPSLWRSIRIIHGLGKNSYRTGFPIAMIQTQLSRTGSLPLHIHYEWREHGSWQPGEEGPMWDLLRRESNRWESLHIHCSTWELAERLEPFLQPAKRRLDGLATVEFIVDSDYVVNSRQWDLFSSAPRLSTVFLTSKTHNDCSPNFIIPWSQITHYRGSYYTAKQLDILRSCTHLVECSLRFFNQSGARTDVPVVLPHLLRLHVTSSEIPTYITAPSLQELLIENTSLTLTPFLERSSCHLLTLILTNLLSIDGLIPLLTLCSSLEHLTFILDAHSKVTIGSLSTLFKALALQPSSTQTIDGICPGLTSLTFGWWSLRGCSWKDTFFAMIRSRAQRLRVVRVLSLKVGGNDFAEELRKQIGYLNRKGSPFDAKQLSGDDAQGFLEGLYL
ncbi:hypothetical protein FB45DRAFT_1060401, partial [Roridomyces roridus]